MELKDLQTVWHDKTSEPSIFKKTFYSLDEFNSLCRRAQELVWSVLDEHKYCEYIYINGIGNVSDLSPIEQIFYIANDTFSYVMQDNLFLSPYLDAQVNIKSNNNDYRVDFLVENVMLFGSDFTLQHKVIIECDGYDSHKTKAQRNRDTERENNLKLDGYAIMRFTGSQIYNDPYLCVMQAIKFIYDQNIECITNEWNAEQSAIEKFLAEHNKNVKKND